MTDSLEAAFQAATERDRAEAERRARVTRMRQMRKRREEAIEAEDRFNEIDHLMRQPPGR